MCASLVGFEQHDPLAVDRLILLHSVALSTGGLPLLYLGDEVATLNDYGFSDDPHKADDSRWVHRPKADQQRYAERSNEVTDAGKVFKRLLQLIQIRKATKALGGTQLVSFNTKNPHVLGYWRGEGERLLVLANFSEQPQQISALTLSALPKTMLDVVSRKEISVTNGLTLAPYQFLWLQMPVLS